MRELKRKKVGRLFYMKLGPCDNLTFDLIYGGFFLCIVYIIMEWISRRNLAEWNAEVVLSSLARTVGGNVHIIFGKRIFANKQLERKCKVEEVKNCLQNMQRLYK